ncbi:DNA (cytosine-5-)-methyltransferase, partial [Planktothrix sp. FACHB-1355]
FIFENVKGLIEPINKKHFEHLVRSFQSIGYFVKWQLLNSYDFGLPQNRERVFIVGIRKDLENAQEFSFPEPLEIKPKLYSFIDGVKDCSNFNKSKIEPQILYGDKKIPRSRNRFQKDDELNDFFVFCDTRDGHTTIHSWDIIRTSEREKLICYTILKNRRKKKYGSKDGNPLSFEDLAELIPDLKQEELDKLIRKNILRYVKNQGYEFVNSKNSAGINGIYRIFLPHSDIIPTLTATGNKDYIANISIEGCENPEEYKDKFIKEIYQTKIFKPISAKDAGKLQGFPDWFIMAKNESSAKKQFGNAVTVSVVSNLMKSLLTQVNFYKGYDSATEYGIDDEKELKHQAKQDINLQVEAKKEAKQEIHALVKFVADTQSAIQNKATKDIEQLAMSFQDTQKAIEQNTQAVANALVNSEKQAREWLQQTIQVGGEVLNFIWKIVNELWSRYWRDRIIDAIRGQRPKHFKAKEVVRKLKQDYPYETNRQIANRLIYEKALFVTITTPLPILAAGIPKVGTIASKITVKFLGIRGLLVEMIYQIGVCYGFDEFKEGDYLIIFTWALRREKLAKLGIDFLLSDSIPDPLIPAVTNMIVFLSVGYAACEFYEAKAKGAGSPIASIEAYTSLLRKIDAYLEEAILEQRTIEATVDEAITVKENLESI